MPGGTWGIWSDPMMLGAGVCARGGIVGGWVACNAGLGGMVGGIVGGFAPTGGRGVGWTGKPVGFNCGPGDRASG